MVVVSVLLMSDSLIAGIMFGADAVAGITLVTPLYSTAAFFGAVFSLGTPIIYSKKMGEAKKEDAEHTFGVALLASLLLSAAMFLLVLLFGNFYLRAYNPSDEVLLQAKGYLLWMKGTILLLPLQLLISSMVYADGDETTSTIANVVQGVGNIVGSIVLSGFMGIQGIGLASFAFNIVSLAILATHFMKKTNTLVLNIFFSIKILWDILRHSIIDASSYLFSAALCAVLSRFITVEFGSAYIILISAITLIREFQMIFDGIGEAILPIISVYLGEECFSGVKRIYREAQKSAIVEGIVVTTAIILVAPLVPRILGVGDAAIANYVIWGIRILALGSTFVSLLYLHTSYDLLVEKILLGLVVSGLRDLFIAAPLGLVFCKMLGLYGLFIAMALAPFIGWLVTTLVLKKKYGDDSPLFLQERSKSKESLLYDVELNPDAIVSVRDDIGEKLNQRGFNNSVVSKTMLLIEELLMSVYEANGVDSKEATSGRTSKGVLGECSLLIEPEKIKIVVRDNGKELDLTDVDAGVTSLRSYVLSNLMNEISGNKYHLGVMSFNRNLLEIKTK